MVDHTQMKLGKRPATVDPRTLKLADYLDPAALPVLPASINYAALKAWAMFLNDHLGCCVPAAMGHQEQADGALNNAEPTIVDADVLAAYEAIGGYNPNDPSTDQGCDPLTACKWWRTNGIAGNTIGAFVSVDPTNDTLVATALYLFGGLFVGLNLPKSAQNQNPWDVVGDGRTGPSEPGSWGGHMVFGCARAVDGTYGVITWGEQQGMTPRFLATYSLDSDLFAVIPADWLNGQGQAPNGFNVAALQRDLAIVGGQADPGPQPDPTPTPTPPTPPPPPPAPSFVPDPYVDSWLNWLVGSAQFVLDRYNEGNLDAAGTEMAAIAQSATDIDDFFTTNATLRRPPPTRGA